MIQHHPGHAPEFLELQRLFESNRGVRNHGRAGRVRLEDIQQIRTAHGDLGKYGFDGVADAAELRSHGRNFHDHQADLQSDGGRWP